MKRRRAGIALALTGLVLAGTPAAARAAATAAPTPPSRLPSGHSWKVTLLTGDVVQVRTQASGPPLVSVKPGSGRRSVPFRKDVRPDGSVRVYPLDVAPEIGRVYDPELFDVTALIREGDDDAHRADLPLIVQGGSAAKALAVRHTLSGLGAVAVRQPKAKGLKAAGLTGARHVWLDRKVHAQALDRNLTRIGAPAAWTAGATGKDVKVAVLDTGVDATHPDLRGRVAEQKNFSQSPDTVDHVGHGTHVAATIAGTGAAANGERKGVAPDADLLIGKVLGDDGSGNESDVIAGMEWAAANAPIVNMSLGSWSPDPANDPVTKALDELSAKDGTLFVVAAEQRRPGRRHGRGSGRRRLRSHRRRRGRRRPRRGLLQPGRHADEARHRRAGRGHRRGTRRGYRDGPGRRRDVHLIERHLHGDTARGRGSRGPAATAPRLERRPAEGRAGLHLRRRAGHRLPGRRRAARHRRGGHRGGRRRPVRRRVRLDPARRDHDDHQAADLDEQRKERGHAVAFGESRRRPRDRGRRRSNCRTP